MKILFADDYENLCEAIKDALEYDGHNVILAKTGEEAYEKIKNDYPNIAFLDEDFNGGLTGSEVCRKIKEENLSTIIVGIGQAISKKAWLKAGADFASEGKSYKDIRKYLMGN